jgi:hypothetical protein
MGRASSANGTEDERIQDFVGKARRQEPLGRPRCEGNIKMDLIEIGWGCMDLIQRAQN